MADAECSVEDCDTAKFCKGLCQAHYDRNRRDPEDQSPIKRQVRPSDTHCLSGHEFTPENTIYVGKLLRRRCRTCTKNYDAAYRAMPETIERRAANSALPENRERASALVREGRRRNPAPAKASWKKSHNLLKEFVAEAKDAPCMDCGVKYPPYVMDFDHRDPATKKRGGVSAAGSIAKAAEEIAKCDLVCSNCHRERTWGPNAGPLPRWPNREIPVEVAA